MRVGRRERRITLAILALLALPPAVLVGWEAWTNNFGTVAPGRIYRSGQMSPGVLVQTIHDQRIKTVLNLRGVNLDRAWYRQERTATTGAGATQIDVALASDQWLSRAQIRAVLAVLDSCEYPLLIHCQWGSERTGLVSAFTELLRPGATLDDAKRQFSLRYLYVPAGDGAVTARHLDQYSAWLRARGWSHTPTRFRLWVRDGYVPGKPSREDWPYQPQPIVVVTRPTPSRTGPLPVVGARRPGVTR